MSENNKKDGDEAPESSGKKPGSDPTELPVVDPSSYLPYPTSTLSPKIVPNDLTSFRSRGVTKVEKELKQQLQELKERYEQVLDDFNWNKLIYEAEFGFEPVMGDTYHLYDGRTPSAPRKLSLIPPDDWLGKDWIGSFRLNVDRRWEPIDVSPDFSLRSLGGEGE